MAGRVGETRGLVASNAQRCARVGAGAPTEPGEWGVRLGSRYYPDYATPHPTAWDGMHGGQFLTPDQVDEMAEHLKACAAWARAQETLRLGEIEVPA